jgi:hypothetical protein
MRVHCGTTARLSRHCSPARAVRFFFAARLQIEAVREVIQNQTQWDFVKRPAYWTEAFFVALLFIVVPKDRALRVVGEFGGWLRGPELRQSHSD